MRQSDEKLVSVVVPAHNAALTIDETLRSIRSQTYRNLEILVVDDGSTDATRKIVEAHVASDSRVRLILQKHGGVAAARNRGIKESTGDLVAPVDADDLWRRDKIERQVEALANGDGRIGLVYCWYAMIDEDSRVRSRHHRPTEQGDVLAAMCLRNLVGNGSSALMTKRAILDAGGYDTTLVERDAQGCEDLKLYFQIAEKYHFAVVEDHLTGYRRTASNMSADVLQMLRSRDLAMSEFRARYPGFADRFHAGRNGFLKWLLIRGIRCRRYPEVIQIAGTMLRHDSAFALQTFALVPVTLTRSAIAPHVKRLLWRVRKKSDTAMGRFPIGAIGSVTGKGENPMIHPALTQRRPDDRKFFEVLNRRHSMSSTERERFSK
jgi:glycosyltransferase involved in cell wall biosynthesis